VFLPWPVPDSDRPRFLFRSLSSAPAPRRVAVKEDADGVLLLDDDEDKGQAGPSSAAAGGSAAGGDMKGVSAGRTQCPAQPRPVRTFAAADAAWRKAQSYSKPLADPEGLTTVRVPLYCRLARLGNEVPTMAKGSRARSARVAVTQATMRSSLMTTTECVRVHAWRSARRGGEGLGPEELRAMWHGKGGSLSGTKGLPRRPCRLQFRGHCATHTYIEPRPVIPAYSSIQQRQHSHLDQQVLQAAAESTRCDPPQNPPSA
jgi:hypothetical protein